MLTVEDYGVIRRAHRDGMSIRAIARKFRHSRRKVRDALSAPEPQPYTRTKERDAPKLGPFKPVIDQILTDDEQAPPKQRHTAMQVFRRLRDEHHYPGGYDQVRRYISGHRQRRRATFIPLSHDPGQRLELDFGHIYADFPDGRRQVPVLIPTWSFSNYAFAISLPTERIEAVLAGMVAAFEFFGCVAKEGWCRGGPILHADYHPSSSERIKTPSISRAIHLTTSFRVRPAGRSADHIERAS